MKRKAIIISIEGTKLTAKERHLFTKEKPWGVILFKRNIKSINQLKNLITTIKDLVKIKNFPIIIDEEGSDVSRLKNIFSHNLNSRFFGNLYKKNKSLSLNLLKHYIFSLSKILKELGININSIPVLDISRTYTNKIIGNRSFSNDKMIVNDLGTTTIKYLHLNKIIGIIKHIPGHGAAKSDSHKETPKVKMNFQKLNRLDFYPFKNSKAKIAMTAHILYSQLDKKNVATFSKKIIRDIIRKKIGFKGILISDDISMKALKYSLVENAKKSLEAGCNLVLYCSGNINDNLKLIKSVPYIDKFTSKKTSEIYKFLR